MSPSLTITEAWRIGGEAVVVLSSRPNARNAPAVTNAATSAPTSPPTSVGPSVATPAFPGGAAGGGEPHSDCEGGTATGAVGASHAAVPGGAQGLAGTPIGGGGSLGNELHPGGSSGGGSDEPTEAAPGSPGAVDDPGLTEADHVDPTAVGATGEDPGNRRLRNRRFYASVGGTSAESTIGPESAFPTSPKPAGEPASSREELGGSPGTASSAG